MSTKTYGPPASGEREATRSGLAPAYLLPEELADRWRVTAGHLANLRSQGRGPVVTKLGKSVRYALADVLAYEQDSRLVSA